MNIGNDAGGTAPFHIGGTAVTVTADALNALGSGLSATELDYLDGATAGTVVASKAVVVDGSKKIDTIDITTLMIGGGTVTASAAELNYIDTSVPGTAIASKALVLGATKNVDTIDVATGGLKVGGTAVAPDAAELNYLDGAGGYVAAYPAASGRKIVSGTVVVPVGGSGTAFVPSGLTSVDYVLASVYSTIETVAGFVNVAAQKSASGGTVTLIGISSAGTASTASGTATYLAIGT